MKNYVRMNQSSKLGRWESESGHSTLGQAEYITAIGNVIQGVTSTLTGAKTAQTQIKAQRDVSIIDITEATKKLGIATTGAVAQTRAGTERVAETYNATTKLVLGAGAALAFLILSSGVAFNLTKKKR